MSTFIINYTSGLPVLLPAGGVLVVGGVGVPHVVVSAQCHMWEKGMGNTPAECDKFDWKKITQYVNRCIYLINIL